MVGDAKQIEMPDFKRVRVARDRFRGLRCVHTHLRGEELNQDDLTDLALLRLDMISAIQVDPKTGLPGKVHSAHLLPSNNPSQNGGSLSLPYMFLEPKVPSQLDVDFYSLITSLETELARTRRSLDGKDKKERAILVAVTTGFGENVEESMAELVDLAESADIRVVDSTLR